MRFTTETTAACPEQRRGKESFLNSSFFQGVTGEKDWLPAIVLVSNLFRKDSSLCLRKGKAWEHPLRMTVFLSVQAASNGFLLKGRSKNPL